MVSLIRKGMKRIDQRQASREEHLAARDCSANSGEKTSK